MRSALLLSESPSFCARAEQALRSLQCRVAVACSVSEALDYCSDPDIAVILVDIGLTEDLAGVGIRLREAGALAPLVGLGVDSVPPGWAVGVPSNAERSDISRLVRALLSTDQPSAASAVQKPARTGGLVGHSPALTRVIDTIERTAPTGATILLQGESGTGKEVLARMVHALSPRASGPFVAVNCAAMPDGLVESTLFGHERGAFTGATQQFVGAFERAHGGTLLLDEVSEMEFGLQAKLLRAIQEMSFERVGGSQAVHVDVRIVATTNRNLANEVDEGRFREDLFYRLSVIPVLVPPLRERREDIPDLAEHFLRQFATGMGRLVDAISPRALEVLMGHMWPGNIRELSHVVERAVALSTGSVLEADDFIPEKRGIAPWRRARSAGGAPSVATLSSYSLREAEAVLIERALEATGGNRTRAADLLEISPRTLRNKLNRPQSED